MSSQPGIVLPVAITSFDYVYGPGSLLRTGGGNMTLQASSAFASANRAVYYPFFLPVPATITQLFCINGATVSGNVDLGIYSTGLSRLVSTGATAQSGTSAAQLFDITDTALPAGRYYMAMSVSNTTATFSTGGPQSFFSKAAGCAQQASAHPLPSTATFATYSDANIYLIGVILGRIT